MPVIFGLMTIGGVSRGREAGGGGRGEKGLVPGVRYVGLESFDDEVKLQDGCSGSSRLVSRLYQVLDILRGQCRVLERHRPLCDDVDLDLLELVDVPYLPRLQLVDERESWFILHVVGWHLLGQLW